MSTDWIEDAALHMCPMCNERPVIVAACLECWARTENGFEMTDEDKAKMALFELAPLTPGHRQMFNELKARWQQRAPMTNQWVVSK